MSIHYAKSCNTVTVATYIFIQHTFTPLAVAASIALPNNTDSDSSVSSTGRPEQGREQTQTIQLDRNRAARNCIVSISTLFPLSELYTILFKGMSL